jgi:hypothetical protein
MTNQIEVLNIIHDKTTADRKNKSRVSRKSLMCYFNPHVERSRQTSLLAIRSNLLAAAMSFRSHLENLGRI